MASPEYLDDFRFCPDCGQPTSSSWQTWGNAVCTSVSPKVKCRNLPRAERNFCEYCGAANPEPDCCAVPMSATEVWFWKHFSLSELPLIALFCVVSFGSLVWLQHLILQVELRSLAYLWLPYLTTGVAAYGLLRALVRLAGELWLERATRVAHEQQYVALPTRQDLPVARVIQARSAAGCLTCGCAITHHATHCQQCGSPPTVS